MRPLVPYVNHSADVLAVDSPPDVEILRPDSGGRACDGDFGEFCAQVCATEDGVTESAADIGYARDPSPRHAQANKVVERRGETWQAPPRLGAMPMLPGLPDPGGLTLENALEPGDARTWRRVEDGRGAAALRRVGAGRDARAWRRVGSGSASEVGGADDFCFVSMDDCNRIGPSWIEKVLTVMACNWAPGEGRNNSG